jgi:hypothetical protein
MSNSVKVSRQPASERLKWCELNPVDLYLSFCRLLDDNHIGGLASCNEPVCVSMHFQDVVVGAGSGRRHLYHGRYLWH